MMKAAKGIQESRATEFKQLRISIHECFLSTHYILGTILNTLHVLSLGLTILQEGIDYCTHFIGEEAKA